MARGSQLTLHGTKPGLGDVELTPFMDRPASGRFSPSGRHFAVAGQSGRIAVHSLAPAARLVELDTGQPVRQMEFCFADALLVVGHTAGAVSLWAIPEGRCIGRVPPSGRPELPTHVAVRDYQVGAAPPLLATALGNRIQLWPLPRPSESTGEAQLASVGPPLATADGVIALAFSPPQEHEAGSASAPGLAGPGAGTQPSEDSSQPGEWLLVITDQPAVRWFNLAARARTPEQWQREVAARTGMAIGAEGQPVPVRQ